MRYFSKILATLTLTLGAFASTLAADDWVREPAHIATASGTIGGIATDGTHIYVLVGHFNNIPSSNSQDCFVMKYSQTGTLVWTQTLGGGYNEYPVDFAVRDGKIYSLIMNTVPGFYSSMLVTMDTNAGNTVVDWDGVTDHAVVPKKLLISPDGTRVYTVGEQTPTSIANSVKGRKIFYSRYNSAGVRQEHNTFSYGQNITGSESFTDRFEDAFVTDTGGITVIGDSLRGNNNAEVNYGYVARLGDGVWGPWAWYSFLPASTAIAGSSGPDSFALAVTEGNGGGASSILKLNSNLNVQSWIQNSPSVFAMKQEAVSGTSDLDTAVAQTSFLFPNFSTTAISYGGSNVPDPAYPRAFFSGSSHLLIGLSSGPEARYSKVLKGTGAVSNHVFSVGSTTQPRFSQFTQIGDSYYAIGYTSTGGNGSDPYFGYLQGQMFLARLN